MNFKHKRNFENYYIGQLSSLFTLLLFVGALSFSLKGAADDIQSGASSKQISEQIDLKNKVQLKVMSKIEKTNKKTGVKSTESRILREATLSNIQTHSLIATGSASVELALKIEGDDNGFKIKIQQMTEANQKLLVKALRLELTQELRVVYEGRNIHYVLVLLGGEEIQIKDLATKTHPLLSRRIAEKEAKLNTTRSISSVSDDRSQLMLPMGILYNRLHLF